MRFYPYSLGCITLVLLLTGCQPTDPNPIFLQTYAEQVASPAYAHMQQQADLLQGNTNACDPAATADFMPSAQVQWRSTMNAWQAAKIIRFGPVVQQRLDWELQFWPDSKNLVARKVRPLLQQKTPLTDRQLATSSVVVHGLSALELLLFDSDLQATAKPERYCELVIWVGGNIAATAHQMDSGWALLQPEFTHPSAESDAFSSTTVAVAKLLDNLLVSLQEIRKDKIGAALGSTDKPRHNPYQLESWRAQHSWQNIQANLASIQQLFAVGGFLQYLDQLGLNGLSQRLQTQLTTLNSSADEIQAPLFTNLTQQTDNLRQLQQQLNQLEKTLLQEVIAVLELPAGFNDQDGD